MARTEAGLVSVCQTCTTLSWAAAPMIVAGASPAAAKPRISRVATPVCVVCIASSLRDRADAVASTRALGACIPQARPLYAETVFASAALVARTSFSGAELALRPLLVRRDLCPAGRRQRSQGRSRWGLADRAHMDD